LQAKELQPAHGDGVACGHTREQGERDAAHRARGADGAGYDRLFTLREEKMIQWNVETRGTNVLCFWMTSFDHHGRISRTLVKKKYPSKKWNYNG
jgi:inosine/xanthosine triphosphate pyrophosphatase family protein